MGDGEQPLIFRDPVLEKTKIAKERHQTLPIVPLDQAILESVTQAARGDERTTPAAQPHFEEGAPNQDTPGTEGGLL